MDLTYHAEERAPVKKEDLKADWIKKEKLTVLTTKEDKRGEEGRKVQQVVRHNETKTGLGIDEADFDKVGFGSSKPQKQVEERKNDKRGRKGNKPQFSAEDFPTL